MIRYIDRKTGAVETEKVLGGKILSLLYGEGFWGWVFSISLLPLIARFPWASRFYGWRMKLPSSRKKIEPFIREYGIDASEFESREFASFNDFFIRKLKSGCRPLADGLICPADGRYLVYPKFSRFFVKGQDFSLSEFVQNSVYARHYSEGSMVIARLCPTDYHRFHFPCDGVASKPVLINGFWYSVNPLALRKRISILSENKRVVTEIESREFGTVLCVEIGATSVGSIHQTFQAGMPVAKGQEKGYFEFGGSCLVLLFEKGRVRFEEDLVRNTERGFETLCRFGELLGKC